MPVPTLPAYPRYDARSVENIKRLETIRDIPPIQDETIQLHHRLQMPGWSNNPPQYEERFQIISMYAPMNFIHERQYEAIKVVGLLREAHDQQDKYPRHFNRNYNFNLIPAQDIDPSHATADLFYIMLNVRPTLESHDADLTPPKPGVPVTIVLDRTSKRDAWRASVIPLPQDTNDQLDICIFVSRPPSTSGTVLTNHSGYFTFGLLNPPYSQERSAVRYAMYGNHQLGINRDNWVKTIRLARENKSLSLQSDGQLKPITNPPVLPLQLTLNTAQMQAVVSSLKTGSTLRSHLTIIVGPPGTGKNVASSAFACGIAAQQKRLLVICGSNYALDVATDRICDQLQACQPPFDLHGMYRLRTDYDEEFGQQFGNDDDQGASDQPLGSP